MTKTQLKKITTEKFRALNNVEVEFGDYITVNRVWEGSVERKLRADEQESDMRLCPPRASGLVTAKLS